MSRINEETKVLIFSDDSEILNSVESALKDEEDFSILDRKISDEEVQSTIAKMQPNIVLFDFKFSKEKTYEIIDNIATQFPAIAVVVIMPESEVNLSDKVILSGARAFILFPFTNKNLLVTLRRVVELLKRNFPDLTSPEFNIPLPVKPKNTFTVFSPKGGTGSTTVAINLAIALKQLIKGPVLLIDGKPLFGDVALMLNIRTGNSITDLISHAGMLDSQLISQVVVDHASGIKVLPSPVGVSEGQGIRPDDLYKVIVELQSTYPVILIDGGNFLHENTVTYMDASDRIIVIITPDLASVRDVRQFMDVCQSLSYPPEKIVLVLNKTDHKADIRQEEIEKILKFKITCKITSDENFVLSSVNEGIPVMVKNPRHPVSKGIQNLALEIKKMITETNSIYSTAESKINSEVLNKTSRLG